MQSIERLILTKKKSERNEFYSLLLRENQQSEFTILIITLFVRDQSLQVQHFLKSISLLLFSKKTLSLVEKVLSVNIWFSSSYFTRK